MPCNGRGKELPGYWKSSLNMAHPEVDMDGDPSERLLLNMFPRPAKAKLIKIRMISFFIVPTNYQDTLPGQAGTHSKSIFHGWGAAPIPLIPEDHIHFVIHFGGFGKGCNPFLINPGNLILVALEQLRLHFGGQIRVR